jgi:uncharacterized membrane protein YqjE
MVIQALPLMTFNKCVLWGVADQMRWISKVCVFMALSFLDIGT